MAFALPFDFVTPFDVEAFVGRRGGCGATCGASARFGGRSCRSPNFRGPGRSPFSETNVRRFELVETPESFIVYFDASGESEIENRLS